MSVTQHPSVCFLPNFGSNQAIDVALQSEIIKKLLSLQKKNCFIPIPCQINSLVRTYLDAKNSLNDLKVVVCTSWQNIIVIFPGPFGLVEIAGKSVEKFRLIS